MVLVIGNLGSDKRKRNTVNSWKWDTFFQATTAIIAGYACRKSRYFNNLP